MSDRPPKRSAVPANISKKKRGTPAPARALLGRAVDVVVVGVVEEQVRARHQGDVDEEHVEDDAQMHGQMRRARVAVQPAVDAHVAEAQRRGEELEFRDVDDVGSFTRKREKL